ncbi:DUF397 domain-containing protein [Streptomyces sp. S.PB5]|uniref:DUF397 domain-containing protein n=1 Tax=Streptomyces sp. S.PB5 TaxID=3020844 RepID=UPI0025AEF65D|nr:DUF397 domain-containing protein [Streptomyces sp. S.PB5]MDN3024789.1 DUF397 domain-containing protein [Streptomyces sp. S.PB5]
MTTPAQWRKSSYSGGGEGNECVETADLRTLIAIRDSKNPTHGTLAFPPPVFATFLKSLKSLKTPELSS